MDKYPVTLSGQFMYRFNALMKIINGNYHFLVGDVDYWWKIEFQLRGSPHVHMVIWCSNIPDFYSPAGIITLINNVLSSSSNTGDEEPR